MKDTAVGRSVSFEAHGVVQPPRVTFADEDPEPLFLLRVGGMGVDHELTLAEARGLRDCLDKAIQEATQ